MTARVEFIDNFKGFQNEHDDSVNIKNPEEGKIDTICACIISKWTSIEFAIINSCEKTFLQIAVIYLEPFNVYDQCILYLDFEKVPESVMNLYEFAKQHTIVVEQDDCDRMFVTDLSNPATYISHKIMNVQKFKNTRLEGFYVHTTETINTLDEIFNRIY